MRSTREDRFQFPQNNKITKMLILCLALLLWGKLFLITEPRLEAKEQDYFMVHFKRDNVQ